MDTILISPPPSIDVEGKDKDSPHYHPNLAEAQGIPDLFAWRNSIGGIGISVSRIILHLQSIDDLLIGHHGFL